MGICTVLRPKKKPGTEPGLIGVGAMATTSGRRGRRRAGGLGAQALGLFAGGLFAGLVFGELFRLLHRLLLLAAQAVELGLGGLGALPRNDELGILDLGSGRDQAAALGLGGFALGLRTLLGAHAGLFRLGLATLLGLALIVGIAHGAADGGSGCGTDRSTGAGLAGLVTDDAADDGARDSADGGSSLGILTRALAAGEADD